MNDERQRFDAASADYARNWQGFDQDLCALCQRYPGHTDRNGINAKLWIIGRSYATGIERKIKSRGIQGSSMSQLADLFESKGDTVDAILRKLEGLREPLDAAKLQTILSVHGEMVEFIRPLLIKKQSAHSFVAKYLHCHCPAVPIYDSVAEKRLAELRPIRQLTQDLDIPKKADLEYGQYVRRFWQLYCDLREAGASVTVKTLDHFILS